MVDISIIDEVDDRSSENQKMRADYLAIEKQVLKAQEDGNDKTVGRLSAELSRIGDRFIRYNLGLAGVIVNRHTSGRSAVDRETYMLACLEGMWEAFISWDPSKGTFGTWSRRHIEGTLWREIRATEHRERTYHEDLALRKAAKYADGIREVQGREPSDEEVADAVGISVQKLNQLRNTKLVSLNAPIGDGSHSLGDILSENHDAPETDDSWDDDTSGAIVQLRGLSDEYTEDHMWLKALAAATSELDDTSLYLVFVRTGLHGWHPENLPEIAAVTGIGREIVRRKTHRALETVAAAGKVLPELL
jgi:DNA-directed RNA polymerase specialized sigma subunit